MFVEFATGMLAGRGSVMVYMSAVKSPPHRAEASPLHGMVQLLEAPNLVKVAKSLFQGSAFGSNRTCSCHHCLAAIYMTLNHTQPPGRT